MYNAVKNGNNLDFNFKRFICDTVADKDAIEVSDLAPGSTALVIETKEDFILNNEKVWVPFVTYSAGGGGAVSGDNYLTIGEIASVGTTTDYLKI